MNGKEIYFQKWNSISEDKKSYFENIYSSIVDILDEMRKLKMWRGSEYEIKEKFRLVLDKICKRLGFTTPSLEFGALPFGAFGYCDRYRNRIVISKPSVITLFHELLHYIDSGLTELEVRLFSIEIYRRTYPKLFEKVNIVWEFDLPFVFKRM